MKKRATKFLVGTINTSVLGKQGMCVQLKKVFIVLFIGILINNTIPLFAQSIVKDWDRAYALRSSFCHTLTDAIRTSDGGYLLAGHYRNCDVIGIVPSDLNAYWVVKTS